MNNPQQNTLHGHISASLKLGIPLVIAQIAHMLITVIDTIMLGWLGVDELAAGTLASQLFFVFLIFALGFGTAIMPLVSGALGKGNDKEVRRSARMGLWALFGLSVIFLVPLHFTQEILISIKQQDHLANLAGNYMDIAKWSIVPAFLLVGLRNFLTAIEQAKIVMWFTLTTTALNAFLNYVLIFGNFGAPRLEMEGAAIATLISNIFACLITGLYVWKHSSTKQFDLFNRLWIPDWQAFNQVIRLGFPISLTILAEAGLFTAATVMVGWIGTIPLAAHGIALQIASIAFMVPLGLSQVATVRVGRAVGRNDKIAIDLAGKAPILLSIGFAIFSGLLLILIPEPLIRLFLDPNNADVNAVLSYATNLLIVAAIFQLVDGLQVVGAGALRGLRDTKIPMIMAAIAYWPVGAFVAWLLGIMLGFGGIGVWAGLAIGLTCAAIMVCYRFLKKEKFNLV